MDSSTASSTNNPSEFLKTILGRPVVVKLNSGVDYRGVQIIKLPQNTFNRKRSAHAFLSLSGVLACLDGYMNIAMEQTEEYVNGQLKAKYGDTFIRGNNGAFCSPSLITLPSTDCFCHRSRARVLPTAALSLSSLRAIAVLYISTQKRR